MANVRNRAAEPDQIRVGYILIDAWREEADLFDAAGKPVTAQRLRAIANRAEAATLRARAGAVQA